MRYLPDSYLSRAIAVVVLAASSTLCFSAHAAGDKKDSDQKLVARGQYVAEAADCVACHTAPGGAPFAGGQPLKSALGTLYGPNITPDLRTGIGSWSKADFEKALRLGVAEDGTYLYPAMPYDAYTKMTVGDMDALWAYLRSVPAVANTPPKNTLPFPFTVRSGLALWQSVYFKPGAYVPDTHRTAQWNRGAYLVEALGHCSECHTPRNAAQGLEDQHHLAGASISGWYAPDISNDSRSTLRRWNPAQLAQFFKTGAMPGNAKAVGPMQEAVHESLSKLTDADRLAMAVYLKAQPSIAQTVTAAAVKLPAERLDAGRRVYEDACSSCHQANGQGISGSVPALAGNDAVTAAEPSNVIMALLEGFAPDKNWGAMASFAHSLTDDQIADVTNYVRTAWGNAAAANATPWAVSTWRRTADMPSDEQHAMLCPDLTAAVIGPAMAEGPAALKEAASNRGRLAKLIADYRAARPTTSSAEVVEALSTAYCRAVAADHISATRMSAEISGFAQHVAVALGDPKHAT